MKWFFTILILIIAIFFYIFAVDKGVEKKVVSLDTIDSLDTLDDSIGYITQTPLSETTLDETTLKPIPQEQTFDTIKNIIENIKGVKTSLTLNSKISSYIYTKDEKDRFCQELSKAFSITLDQAQKSFSKNKLVWDFVNEFKD